VGEQATPGEVPFADVLAVQQQELSNAPQPQEAGQKGAENGGKDEGLQQGVGHAHRTPPSSPRCSSDDGTSDDSGSSEDGHRRSRDRGWRTQQRSPDPRSSPAPRGHSRGRSSSRSTSRSSSSSSSSSRSSSWDPYNQPGRIPREAFQRDHSRGRYRSRSRSRLRGRSHSLSPVAASRRYRSRSRSVSREGRGYPRSPHTVPKRWEGRSRQRRTSPLSGGLGDPRHSALAAGAAVEEGAGEPQLDTLFVGDLPADVTAKVCLRHEPQLALPT
jgi:hypothetical protein